MSITSNYTSKLLYKYNFCKIFYNWYSISPRKIYCSSFDAVKDIPTGATLLIGGYGLCGLPENLIGAMYHHDALGFTVVSSDIGIENFGVGLLLSKNKIRKLITSYVGNNEVLKKQFFDGDIEIELSPQGTLAERIRAGGAGIPAFFLRTSYGTTLHEGGAPHKYDNKGNIAEISEAKLTRGFHKKDYIMERAIKGDYALIKAKKADTEGNLVFSKSARNINPTMAKAARTTIAEVEEIVNIGELDPDEIHLPGIYVNRVIIGEQYEKCIEITATLNPDCDLVKSPQQKLRDNIAKRIALEFKDGIVNLGAGIPMTAYKYIPENASVYVHSENGIIGVGPYPTSACKGQLDYEIINARKESITIVPGSSYFSMDDSFGMIRGGHIDLTCIEALEVSEFGDIANAPDTTKGIGSSMDLVSASKSKIIVCLEHKSNNILKQCNLPLIGKRCVDMIITEKCVFKVDPEKGLTLIELAEGVDQNDVSSSTGCDFNVALPYEKIEMIN